MNKSILRKIAYELKMKLHKNTKAFIFVVCQKYLQVHKKSNRDKWIKKYLQFDGDVSKDVLKFLNDYDDEFENLEAIGWLYQYFISDEKERVFNNLMNSMKVEKEDIPFATQLFTPNWIVKYLVENSLGEVIKNKKLEEITFIDPCQGTGNILLYAFEVLFQEYMRQGYDTKEAVLNILTKNLYGIDIDETVCTITRLLLILNASKYFEDVFDFVNVKEMNIVCLNDEYGSLRKNICGLKEFDVVCTNPPYMGKKNINSKLSEFLKKEYPDTKSELYAAFIERCLEFTKDKGYLAMITIHSWMFISSFAKLRKKLLDNGTFISMLHTGAATFDDLSSFNALATSFVFKKEKLDIESCFIRLADYYNLQEKMDNIDNPNNYYYIKQEQFLEIPNQPFIYWISENIRKCFKENKKLSDFYLIRQGLATGDNKEFVRLWYEVPINEIGLNYKTTEEFLKSKKVYAPYNKGGIYRKWYGNIEYVIKFDKANYEKLMNQGNHLPSRNYYFQKGITWSLFGFENFGVRFKENGYVFDVSGSSMFPKEEDLYYVMGYLCSNVCFKLLSCLAPTVNFQVGNIASLPFKISEDFNLRKRIDKLVQENIGICREEWSFYETNREFQAHPFVMPKFSKKDLKETVNYFKGYYCQLRDTLRKNEEELNRIYTKIFNVVEDIDCLVNDRDLTIKPFQEQDWIKSYLSYLVGCTIGRYDAQKLMTNDLKCQYDIDTDKMCLQIKKEMKQSDISYIEGLFHMSIERFWEKEFVLYHTKLYQNHPIYFLKNNSVI